MADLTVRGIVGHLHRKQYDFVTQDGQRLQRDGHDLYVLGSALDDVPTVVQCDDLAVSGAIAAAGQGARVELTCSQKGKRLVCSAVEVIHD